MNRDQLKKHLEQRQSQLTVSINLLQEKGATHPGYNQLSTLEEELETVNNQLERLLKLMGEHYET
jgi:hypothetical protein